MRTPRESRRSCSNLRAGFRSTSTVHLITPSITRRSVAENYGCIETVSWTGESIRLIDQTLLPARFEIVEIQDWREAVQAIRTMVVRGAPAIGCTAALGLALAARELRGTEPERFREGICAAADGF